MITCKGCIISVMSSKKIKIVTLGAAVQDVFLMGSMLKAKRDVRSHDFVEQFPLGAKVEIDRVVFSSGGGATNAAVTFARHGFETAFMGKIGDDPAGQYILRELQTDNVDTGLIKCDLDGISGYSTILLAPGGERTVLVYRGVSEELKTADFKYFAKLQADWLYITSLAGNLPLLEHVVHYASTHGIKIAIDPGSRELAQVQRFRKLVPKFSVLKGNRQEIGQLFPGRTSREIVSAAVQHCPVVVVTDGPNGSYASDGQLLYHAGMYEDVPVLDRTGAGDAFGSGLVAKLANGASLEEALVFGSANSTAVVQKIGAKAGILHKNAKLRPMEIVKTKLKTSPSEVPAGNLSKQKEPAHA